MVLKSNKKLWAASGLLFFLSLLLFFNSNNSNSDSPKNLKSVQENKENFPHQNQDADRDLNQEQIQERGNCIGLKKALDLKNPITDKEQQHSQIFNNIHLEIGSSVYRTRFFFEDGEDKPIATYIVYLEDEDGFPLIKEQSSYEPGELFKSLTNSKDAKIIYKEEGIVNTDEDTFYHVENDKIIQVQSDEFHCNF